MGISQPDIEKMTDNVEPEKQSDSGANVPRSDVVMWRAAFDNGESHDFLTEMEARIMVANGPPGRLQKMVLMPVETLVSWCNEAADDIDSWACYAGEYFQEKHDLNGDIKNWRGRAEMLDT